jgi:hypothetical protein
VASVGSTDPADVQFLLDAIRAANLTVRRVQLIRPSLEDLFIDVVAARPSPPEGVPTRPPGFPVPPPPLPN